MPRERVGKEKKIFIVQCMGQHILAYRQAHKMTKSQFAKDCGISRGFLTRLENGEANPTLDLIEKLADFIGISPAKFLFPPDDKEG